MTTIRKVQTIPFAMIAMAALLALIAAITYILIGRGILSGDASQISGKTAAIIYAAAGSYLFGGLLMLLRRRWLWIAGLVVNALVILFFFTLFQDQPSVISSTGQIVSRTTQLLLEFVLVYLIVMDWRRSRS